MKEDDIVAQIETDKVTIDVKYQESTPGVIKELFIKVGADTAVRLQCVRLCRPSMAFCAFILVEGQSMHIFLVAFISYNDSMEHIQGKDSSLMFVSQCTHQTQTRPSLCQRP